MTTIPKLYTLEEIEKAVGSTSSSDFETKLIQSIRDGFVALERGEFFACPIQTMGLVPFPFLQDGETKECEGYAAQTCVKSGYFLGQKYYVIKVASGGYPMPSNSGLMQVYSQRTGQLEALLLDNGILTEIRTAAVGALAAQLLAPKNIQCIGIIGTGIQARYQLQMLSNVTDCKNVLVWGRSESKAKVFQDEMMNDSTKNVGWKVNIATNTEQLLYECDLIITTTCAKEAILGKVTTSASSVEDIKKKRKEMGKTGGLHITCIGADAPGKFELDPTFVSQVDLLVADTVQQSIERGEFQMAVKEGLVKVKNIISLGKFIQNTDLHRKSSSNNDDDNDDRITIFDSSGVALQDCVVAQMTYEALKGMQNSPLE